MPQPRLLFLSHLLPYPPDSGAAIRTYNILRLLAREFDVSALCFYRKDPTHEALGLTGRVQALSAFAPVRAFPIPQQGQPVRLLWDHLRSLLSGRPYTAFVHDSADFSSALREMFAAGRFDVVHLDSMDLVRFLPELHGLPVVCTHHNVESDLLRRRADTERSALLRAYLRLQAGFLAREERRWLPRLGLNIAVSPDDQAGLARLAPGGRYAVIPNGVDTEYFRPFEGPEAGCIFVGGTNWFPNRDGLEWFAEAVLPQLRRREESAPVRWVGHVTPEEQSRFGGRAGLELVGYVDDIRPHVHRARCFIVPLRVGGGTRLKVLDAWAMGKAVVSTAIGCEGLATRPGENILIADTAEDMASAIARVLNDTGLRHRLGRAGRRTVEERYSWERIGGQLGELYRSVARLDRPAGAQVVGEGSSG